MAFSFLSVVSSVIGADLCARLRRHKRGLATLPSESAYFFVGKDGKALKEPALISAFQKLCRLAGIERHDGATYPAAHARLTSDGRSASPERYLKLTPERFRMQLVKLSPRHPRRKRWRDDAGLMKFLDRL